MSYKPTGRMIESKPHEEKEFVCDQCGAVMGTEYKRNKPHFAVEWRPELHYDDEGTKSWRADLCSLECLQAYAMAGAPRVKNNW